MTTLRFAAILLVACSSPASAPPVTPPAPVVPLAEPSVAPPVTLPVAAPPVVAPTERSAEDLAREAAREPLAIAMVDAYANYGGLFSSLVARWSPDGKQILYGSARDGLPE